MNASTKETRNREKLEEKKSWNVKAGEGWGRNRQENSLNLKSYLKSHSVSVEKSSLVGQAKTHTKWTQSKQRPEVSWWKLALDDGNQIPENASINAKSNVASEKRPICFFCVLSTESSWPLTFYLKLVRKKQCVALFFLAGSRHLCAWYWKISSDHSTK